MSHVTRHFPMNRRVVITGMGVVTPVGNDLETFWDNLRKGVSGIGRIQAFDTSGYDCQIAGEVSDFEPKNYFRNAKDEIAPIVIPTSRWRRPRWRWTTA